MSGNSGVFGEVAKGLVDQSVVNVVPGRNTGHTRGKEIKGGKRIKFSYGSTRVRWNRPNT